LARLHEYQSKELLKAAGLGVPDGRTASTADEARQAAEEVGLPAVIKAQAWVTARADKGAVAFVETADEAEREAAKILALTLGGFPVAKVLVERKMMIEREFYAGVIVDDAAKAPVVIFSSMGGTGIEEIARQHPDKVARAHVDLREGFPDFRGRQLVLKAGVKGRLVPKLGQAVARLWKLAREHDARSAEINPLALTPDGKLVALDCRITVDDYSVYRQPELGIEIAREFDHPPTELDKIAYRVEAGDYRGTFYFVQLEQNPERGKGFVAFHGAGGGGSMMSMDALLAQGFRPANFTDTSGNPPASKVYRAAKIILAQEGLDGYFASGSGVASQEQFHSARGFAKAFRELGLWIPAVIRLGGNQEDIAIRILREHSGFFPAPLEGYGKDDSADFCARRLRSLIDETPRMERPRPAPVPAPTEPYRFRTLTGEVVFDYALCRECSAKVCIEACQRKILALDNDLPVLAIEESEAAKGKCTECLACELDCILKGNKGVRVDLPIPGLDEYLQRQ
jgi:succinyl-CoA synthetase beta subunit